MNQEAIQGITILDSPGYTFEMRTDAHRHSAPIITSLAVTERLSARVVHDLALHIIRSGLKQPFLLPTEPDLCEQFKVSRTVLREAIRTLQARGLVTVVHGQGMLGQPKQFWNHLDPEVLNWRCEAGLDEHFVLSLYEVRQIFEPAAAALCATRSSDDDLDRLQASFYRMQEAIADPEQLIEADLDFHNIIVSSCGNELLAQFSYSIAAALRMGHELSRRLPSDKEESCALHKPVLEAIRSRDPEGASAGITVLISKALRDVRSILSALKG